MNTNKNTSRATRKRRDANRSTSRGEPSKKIGTAKDILHGHKRETLTLWNILEKGREGAFLLYGPSGIGKKKLVLSLAQGRVCTSPLSEGKGKMTLACGTCAPCQRILSGTSQSFFAITLHEKDLSLKIGSSRQIISFLQLRSTAKERIILIDECHLLTPQASNALLKILEESPPSTFFFFITHAKSLLLPTLSSRLKTLYFSPLSLRDLENLFPAAPSWALRLSQGNATKLESWAELPQFPHLRQQALHMLIWLLEQREEDLFSAQWKSLLGNREQAFHLLYHWWTLLRDAFSLRFSMDKENKRDKSSDLDLLLNEDLKENETFVYFIKKLSPLKMKRFYKALIELEKRLCQNKDVQLSFDGFYFYACDKKSWKGYLRGE